jgi:hypothetical protein
VVDPVLVYEAVVSGQYDHGDEIVLVNFFHASFA